MFDCGCHDNDTSNALNMAFFVHSPSKPTTTQKYNGAFKNLFLALLHFLQESLLRRNFSFSTQVFLADLKLLFFLFGFTFFDSVESHVNAVVFQLC